MTELTLNKTQIMKKLNLITIILFLLSTQNLIAQHEEHQNNLKSEYVGEESRVIKSLSKEDIEELRNGKGWGFAKVAELNGVPGPLHLLEMKAEIKLSASQITKIEALYTEMKGKAVKLGNKLVDAEQELNRAFADRTIQEKELKNSLLNISNITGQLRFVHLSAHLKTMDILTEEQIMNYNKLRGYSDSDPCENIPEGHDPEMWKRHNNCS